MYDLIIKNGMIYTGAGNPWFKADIAIKDGFIAEFGRIKGEAYVVLDSSGKAVTPGFIDLHDQVTQGVSTIVFPSCGGGAAPINDKMREDILRRNPYL